MMRKTARHDIRDMQGQAMIEYTIVLMFTVVVMWSVLGEAETRDALLNGIKSFFTAFSYAISITPQ